MLMPVRYICGNCGYILSVFYEVGQDYYGVPTPEEVYRIHGGICPKCKHDLSMPTLNDIRITSARKYEVGVKMPVAGRKEVSIHH
jgi:ribosomal protein S27AE